MAGWKVTPDLLNWQWSHYQAGHQSRPALMVHALTFVWVGGGIVLAGLGILSSQGAWVGLGLMLYLGAMAAQGVAHSFEKKRPEPFLSPLDFVVRFTLENLITFPRFLLSGGFAKAWRSGA
jgi:hypothetical protein